MPLVIALLLGLAALLIVVYPLLGLETAGEATEDAALAEVGEQESSARQALRDVDFDRRLGNLDDADYHALQERLEERALEAMKARYARERALDAKIERQLAALRTERRPGSAPAQAAKTAKPAAATPRKPAESATRPGADTTIAAETADASPHDPFPRREGSRGLGSRRRGA